jgi:hypothetical protein
MAAYGSTKTDGWEPSVKYLIVLIFAEILLMGVLRTYTKHGG